MAIHPRDFGRKSHRSERMGVSGRVVRIRDRGQYAARQQAGSRRRPAGSGESFGRQAVIGWSLGFCVLTLLVLGGFIAVWLHGHASRKGGHQSGKGPAEVRVVSQFVSPGEDEAIDLVKRALSNRDVEQVPELFRMGAASAPEIVAFMAATPQRDGMIERYVWVSSIDIEGMLLEGVLVAYSGAGKNIDRLAFLTPDEKGVWKLDFEGFARVSRPPWQEVLGGRAERAQVRVIAARDAYYNGGFADESQWSCYGMVSLEADKQQPEGEQLLYGYCRRGSRQDKALAKMFGDGARTRRATFEIVHQPGTSTRQFEIRRVLAEDWVVAPRRYDENF